MSSGDNKPMEYSQAEFHARLLGTHFSTLSIGKSFCISLYEIHQVRDDFPARVNSAAVMPFPQGKSRDAVDRLVKRPVSRVCSIPHGLSRVYLPTYTDH